MHVLKNLSVRAKLLVFFLLLATTIAAQCGFLAYQAQKVFHQADDLASNWMPAIYVLGDMSSAVSKLRQMELSSLRSPKPQDVDEMNIVIADLERERKVYEAMISSDDERATYALFSKDWASALTNHAGLLALASKHNQKAAQDLAWGPSSEAYQSELSNLGSLIDANVQGGAEAQSQAINANHSSRHSAIGIAVTLILSGIGLSLLVSSMVRNLRKSVLALQRMAARDLTAHLSVDSKDEFGQMAVAVNGAVEAMSTALQDMSTATGSLSDASSLLVGTSESLASGTNKSSSSLVETASSLEQITTTVRLNADNARHARTMTTEACEVAVSAGVVVQSAVDAMSQINDSSRKVAAIVTSIDEIAFQTNLLAINAAIEASIAGDEGRGFAVVAQEVRILAQRTASSAKEIKTLIAESLSTVERGSESVNGCGKTLREILSAIERVSRVVDEISGACTEQAAGIEHVNTAVAQIDRVTQSGAQETENLSTTARQLAHQATHLKEMLSGFTFERTA